MKKKFLVLVIVLIFNFESCSIINTNKLDVYVENEYLKCKEKCVLDFNNLFEYDRLYIFGIGTSNEDVSKSIGFTYNGDKDISRLVLFVKNKTIIYEQNLVFNDSDPFKVNFITNNEYFTNDVKFSLEKEEGIFILKPIDK